MKWWRFMSVRRLDNSLKTTLSQRSASRIMEASGEFACVIGFDGRLKQLNASWQRELGYSVDSLASTPFIDLVHPLDRSDVLVRMRAVTAHRVDAIDVENRLRRNDGTYRWLRWRFTVDRHERLVYGLAQDITDLQASNGVPDSDARYRLMFDASDTLAVTDADAVFTYVSPASVPLLGYAPEELIGRRIAQLVHPEDRTLARIAQTRITSGTDGETTSLRYRRKDGTYAWIESKNQPVFDPATGALQETQVLMRDVGERREAEMAMERQALTDALTGLANRVLLSDRLNQALKRLKRNPGLVGVLMLDLDHFKVINDTLGHQVGDEVLIATARRLQRLARPDDTVARFGGDEFVVLVQGLHNAADLAALADRIVSALREPCRVGKEHIEITVSIGVAITSLPDQLSADLLREADLALYKAKDRGRDRHEIYGEALQARAIRRLETERLLRRAIASRSLAVEYQPIVHLASEAVVEVEALLRIDDVELGRLTPEHYLAVAEETGLLVKIDEWVRVNAFTQLAAWRADRSLRSVGRLAVNVTARELAAADFAPRIAAQLHEAGLRGGDLAVEVTEQVLLQTSNSAINSLVELRHAGVRIGLDDFGTGFSALSYLQTFPLDFLKIDRSFVERVAIDARSAAIVAATISLAHALDLEVVAEGIETQEQLTKLRSFGCDRGQGFVFSSPRSAEAFAEVIRKRPVRASLLGVKSTMPERQPVVLGERRITRASKPGTRRWH